MNCKKLNTYDFFFKETRNYEWINFFRSSFGLFILLHFLSILPDFDALFSTKGIIPSDILDVFIPNFLITLPKIVYFFDSYGIAENNVLLIFKIMYISFSLFILIGFFTRISAFFLLFLQISLVKGASFYAYGVDYFTSMSLFYLILIPSDYSFSIQSYFKSEVKKVNLRPFQRLFQIHLSISYFFSGLGKILGFNWWNGESIWKAINLPFANNDFNFDFSLLAEYPITLIIISWSTIIIEMFYPIFIWIPRTRRVWLYLTILLHIGIALVINLYFFSALMIIWNISNFYFYEKPLKKI